MPKLKRSIFEAVENADPDGIDIEALIQAETQFMLGEDIEDEDEDEYDDAIHRMAYKDDDGYWVVTGNPKKYKSYGGLLEDYPDIG